MATRSYTLKLAVLTAAAALVLAPSLAAAQTSGALTYRVPLKNLIVDTGASSPSTGQGTVQTTPTSLDFGNVTPGATAGPLHATLLNTGTASLSVSGVNADPPFSVSSNCPASLAPGASCSAAVSLAASSLGAITGHLTFSTSAGAAPVNLSGYGAAYIAALSPASLEFGNVNVGTGSSKVVTLSNTGNEDLAVNSAQATGAFGLSGNTCGTTVAAGASCTLTVAFQPSAMGDSSGALTIQTAAGAKTVALHGVGIQQSQTVSAGSLSFGAVNVGASSTTQSVTLTNTGNIPLPVQSIYTRGTFEATSNCGTSVAVGASCLVNVTFTPTSMGASSGLLYIQSNAATATVSLDGTGLLGMASASPTSLTFGNQAIGGTSAAQTVTLSNPGNAPVTLAAPSVAAPFAMATTCGASLAANGSCSYSVTFAPTAGGSTTGTLSIPTSAGVQSISLTGAGITNCAGGTTTVTQTADVNLAAPAGCNHASVSMWGAGGGGYSAAGGGGGSTVATIALPDGATILVQVGQGGVLGTICEFGTGTYCPSAIAYKGGYGGGGSYLWVNGTLTLAAGGGGGGGGTGSTAGGTAGGAGGGLSGVAGNNISYDGTGGGRGGAQTAGGAAGPVITGFAPGTAGASLLGGLSANVTGHVYGGGGASGIGWSGNGAGGGGGGGYFGGGAGSSGGYYYGGAGGGGGSGYIAPGATGTATAGSGATPGNSSSSLRGNAGNGGTSVTNGVGSNGLVSITWTQ